MEPSTAAATPDQPGSMSALERIAGIFWSPKRTFEDIAARPTWVAPVILLMICGLVVIGVYLTHIGVETMLRQQFATNPRMQQMDAQQRAQAIAVGTRMAPPLMIAAVSVGGFIGYLLTALVLMLGFKLLASSQVTYKQSLGITTHAFLPHVIASLLAVIVMLFVNPADFNINNAVMSNAAWLLADSAPMWLKTLAGSLDLFSIWVMVLLAMGFSTTKRKLGFGMSLVIVAIPWILVVLVRTAWTAAFT